MCYKFPFDVMNISVMEFSPAFNLDLEREMVGIGGKFLLPRAKSQQHTYKLQQKIAHVRSVLNFKKFVKV